ncbi:unnamed protein product, partial [Staurois parvus]
MSLYIGGHWEECPFILVVIGKNVPLYWSLVIGKNVPYIGGHWEECPFALVVIGKNVPYIGGQNNVPYIGVNVKNAPLT